MDHTPQQSDSERERKKETKNVREGQSKRLQNTHTVQATNQTCMNWIVSADFPTPPPPTTTSLYSVKSLLVAIPADTEKERERERKHKEVVTTRKKASKKRGHERKGVWGTHLSFS